MSGWIESANQAATDFVAWILDLIEGAWKKAIAPKDE
jgi:hypothetical protein